MGVYKDGWLPVIKAMHEYEPSPVEWLWPGRIPLGKLTMVVGDPGVGKSYLTADIAARVSKGECWPDGQAGTTPGDTVLLSCEDDPADTIRPRLMAHTADLNRVHMLEGHKRIGELGDKATFITFDTELESLARALRCMNNPRLVVVDPITAYMGKLDANSNSDVRGMLARLGNLARAFNVAMVLISHLNKDVASGSRAIYRTLGAISFCAAARVVYHVRHDGGGTRVIVPAKSNLRIVEKGMSYTILDDGRVGWMQTDLRVSETEFEVPEETPTALDKARLWLSMQLVDGALPATMVLERAAEQGVSAKTLRRAMDLAYVRSVRRDGRWLWELIPEEQRAFSPRVIDNELAQNGRPPQ